MVALVTCVAHFEGIMVELVSEDKAVGVKPVLRLASVHAGASKL